MSTPSQPAADKVDALIASRGAASLGELGLGPAEALALARARPDLEPVFLVRFRSRGNQVRVEEVRAYAWPSQRIGLGHLGYRAEDARMLRLEPRQRVPFPERLYATFLHDAKLLEELRKAEKAYRKAIKQAPSKPGRAEGDLQALQPAFKALGDELALELWIEAAAIFQRLDNSAYASKMLGNLLKLVEKDKKIDASMLARTVLSAADDGVFHTKLYEHTWELVQQKLSTQSALGLGLRIFRRLMDSGRALPTDFVKDLRRAAIKGKVADFEPLFDANIVWAAGLAAFWNTAKRGSSWRDEVTEDHAETQLIRARLRELWQQANGQGAGGEAWKSEVWDRVRAAMPELSTYGRTVLVELLVEAGGDARADAERLLDASLAMLARPPRTADRERVERTAGAALARVTADAVWDKAPALEEALRVSSGHLVSFVTLYDLLSDLGESIPARAPAGGGEPVPVVRSLPGLLAAWMGALVAALKPKKDGDDGDDNSRVGLVGPLGEALALLKPEQAAEHLAELGPLLARRLASDLHNGSSLELWERVLGTLRALGPVGAGITAEATRLFLAESERLPAFGNAAPMAHFLDGDALRRGTEARGVVDEALALMAGEVKPEAKTEPLLAPEKALGEAPRLLEAVKLPEGGYSLLWTPRPAHRWSREAIKRVATTLVSGDGAQREGPGAELKDAAAVAQWVTPAGLRFVVLREKSALLMDATLGKTLAKLAFGESDGWSDSGVAVGRRCAILTFQGKHVLVDSDFKVMAELEATGYGTWSLLEGPEGSEPVVLFHRHGGLFAAYSAPDKRAPAFKLPDLQWVTCALRTDDGAWSIEYEDRKGAPRRARLDEAQGRWVSSSGAVPPERPVVSACDLGRTSWIPVFGGLQGYVHGFGGQLVLHDLQGRPAAALSGSLESLGFDPLTGVSISAAGVTRDPTAPARIAAAPALRAAITGVPEEPLARVLYADEEALAVALEERIAARPQGQEALRLLGAAARPLVRAATAALRPVLDARGRVLEVLDAPAPAPRTVPPRVPGVRRTAIRRAARTGFGALDGLVFWALDGDDAGPVVEHLLPQDGVVSANAWPTALRLVGLAQSPGTEPGLAERALRVAEALLAGLEAPGRRFSMEPRNLLELDDNDSDRPLETEGAPEIRSVDGLTRPVLWKPWGRYPKNDPPVALPEAPTARRAAVEGWVRAGLLAPLSPKRLEALVDRAGALQLRAICEHAGATFLVDVVVYVKKQGLEWQLWSLAGSGDAAAWNWLRSGLEQGFEQSNCSAPQGATVWTGAQAPRREELDALRSGIGLTRAFLSRRDQLQLDAWEPAAIAELEDPVDRRYVTLTWLLGELRAEEVGTTRGIFEKVIKQTGRWLDHNYGTLRRKRVGKGDEHVAASPVFAELLRTSLVKWQERRGQKLGEAFIVLREPAELVAACARELGLSAGKSKGQKQ